jgi:hypothetical protein
MEIGKVNKNQRVLAVGGQLLRRKNLLVVAPCRAGTSTRPCGAPRNQVSVLNTSRAKANRLLTAFGGARVYGNRHAELACGRCQHLHLVIEPRHAPMASENLAGQQWGQIMGRSRGQGVFSVRVRRTAQNANGAPRHHSRRCGLGRPMAFPLFVRGDEHPGIKGASARLIHLPEKSHRN